MSNVRENDNDLSVLLHKATLLGMLTGGRMNLEKDGYVQPMLFVELSNGEEVVYPIHVPDDSSDQYQIFRTIGKKIRSEIGSIQCAVTIFETWTVFAKEAPDAMKYKPSQHPCRQEAIVLVGRNADKSRSALVIQTFTRDEHNAPVWSDPKVMFSNDGSGGVVAGGLIDALFDE